ncbi:MAG: proteasome subunit beta [Blastopirellula sp.]|nr:MAG: proteasome subunit beta [Blastopirellula sp.]
MTTIALDSNGLVAFDSRVTEGSTIVDDAANKHIKRNGVHYFFSGRDADEELLIAAVEGAIKEDYADAIDVYAIIYKDGAFYTAGISQNDGYFWQKERLGNCVAIGSGGSHALTAMDCGLDAKEAVKMAIKRNAGSGGRVRTIQF